MSRYRYMRLRFNENPQEIIDAYKLDNLVHNNYCEPLAGKAIKVGLQSKGCTGKL